MQLLLEKIAKNHDFGDFWWFSCFWHDVTYDVTVASYKVCLYFFWYQWTREGHSYPLVPHTWCFVNRFPRSWVGRIHPQLWDGSKMPGSFRVKRYVQLWFTKEHHLTIAWYFQNLSSTELIIQHSTTSMGKNSIWHPLKYADVKLSTKKS